LSTAAAALVLAAANNRLVRINDAPH
jgi:hypothetical protein